MCLYKVLSDSHIHRFEKIFKQALVGGIKLGHVNTEVVIL